MDLIDKMIDGYEWWSLLALTCPIRGANCVVKSNQNQS
jgi:hypothetical protein